MEAEENHSVVIRARNVSFIGFSWDLEGNKRYGKDILFIIIASGNRKKRNIYCGNTFFVFLFGRVKCFVYFCTCEIRNKKENVS